MIVESFTSPVLSVTRRFLRDGGRQCHCSSATKKSCSPSRWGTASPRSAFDDVDDYDSWTASPPQYRDGTTIPNRTGWRQRVVVTRVTPANPTVTSGTDQGAKRIRVKIEYKDQILVDQSAIRTDTDAQ